jgi:DnaK suppressor protein
MTITSPTSATLDPNRLAAMKDTLQAMLRDRVPPLAGDDTSAARHLAHVRSLEEALGRVANGSYGRCLWCGGGIPIERLEVVPTALGCRGCSAQQR